MPDDTASVSPAPEAPVSDAIPAPVAEGAPVTDQPAEPSPSEVEQIQQEPQVQVLAPEVQTLEQQLGVERVDVLPREDHGFLVLIGQYRFEVTLEELAASGDIVGIIRQKYRALLPS